MLHVDPVERYITSILLDCKNKKNQSKMSVVDGNSITVCETSSLCVCIKDANTLLLLCLLYSICLLLSGNNCEWLATLAQCAEWPQVFVNYISWCVVYCRKLKPKLVSITVHRQPLVCSDLNVNANLSVIWDNRCRTFHG